jgi:Ni/Fe-hydrogenase subunit HybB-like protein
MGGTVLNRFDVTWFAIASVNGETYTPHWMEIAILVGVASGLVTVYSLIARYFPVYEETESAHGETSKAHQLHSPAVGD